MPSQVIRAPQRLPPQHNKSIFLAGTTDSNWREHLIGDLKEYPLTIYEPFRKDWDSTWKEDISDERFTTQVQWELEMQEKADLVIVFFSAEAKAPVSLIELGLCARAKTETAAAAAAAAAAAIIVCEEGFWKKGNVQVVCRRYGLGFLESGDQLAGKVVSWLERGRWEERVGRESGSECMM
jgi:hypothetical protein